MKLDECFVESENIEEADQGWAAWAWSFVPQLASDGAMAELTESDGQQSVKKVEQSVFDVGIYVMQASVIFKVCIYAYMYVCALAVSLWVVLNIRMSGIFLLVDYTLWATK